MPSLKDLRNRIGSVKATRKITKAMQMVAAAKLRRAQEAATSARPYAERMDRLLGNLGARANRVECPEAAGRHRQGRGASADRHDRRARPVRRLQFEHRQARQGRRHAAARGRQDRQDHRRRPQGRRQPAPRPRQPDHRSRRPARAQADRLRRGRRHCPQGARPVRGRRVRRRHPLLLRVQVGDDAEADRPAADPGQTAARPAPAR